MQGEVKICKEIMADPTKNEPVRRVERGLYCNGTEPIPEGTWVASFGPVRCNDPAPMATVNVRTVKIVQWEPTVVTDCGDSRRWLDMSEILVDYGPDFRKIVGVCRCCACRKATPRCERRSSA